MPRFHWRQVIAAWLLLLSLHAPAQADLVLNGDFAGGLGTGWTFNYGPTSRPPVPPFDCGINCGFLSTMVNGQYGWLDPWDLCQCTISQDLATTAGQTYQVSYTFGIQVDVESPGRFNAWFDGAVEQSVVGGFTGPGIHPVPWQLQQVSFLVTATDTSSRLEFGGLCPGCNFFVSNVSVQQLQAVPLPGTVLLAGLGLLALGVPWRRQRRGS